MKLSSAKDKILHFIEPFGLKGEHSEKIAEVLEIPHCTVVTAAKEMFGRNHVSLISTASYNMKMLDPYIVKITEEGRHFANNSTYRKESIAKWFEEIPKKYWLATDTLKIVIGLVLGFALRIATEPKDNQGQSQGKVVPAMPKSVAIENKNAAYPSTR